MIVVLIVSCMKQQISLIKTPYNVEHSIKNALTTSRSELTIRGRSDWSASDFALSAFVTSPARCIATAISVAITKYFFTKYFTLNTFFEKITRTKYFLNFGISTYKFCKKYLVKKK